MGPELSRDLINAVLMSVWVSPRLRWRLLRLWGVEVGAAYIAPGGFFGGPGISIGAGAYLNRGVFIDPSARVAIGARCHIGMEAMFVTSRHELGGHDQRAGAVRAEPISVGEGCWLGARVTVLGGVHIGGGCVVASGAVVTEDCAADGLYAGVPARRVRDLA